MKNLWNGWRVVLASGSPRRKELLAQIGIEAQIMPSQINEFTGRTDPEGIVEDLSRQKVEAVTAGCPERTVVIGADTMVAVDGEAYGKPRTPQRAVEMLSKLQDGKHQVYTGVTLLLHSGEGKFCVSTFVERTDVWVYPMTEAEILSYVESGEPLDKAGAYGIQGPFARYIRKIDGDYSNVVGLPLGRLYHEMKSLIEEIEKDD